MELGTAGEDTNSEDSWTQVLKKMKHFSNPEIKPTPSPEFSNVAYDMPSTSGVCSSTSKVTNKTATISSRLRKRKGSANVVKEVSRAKQRKTPVPKSLVLENCLQDFYSPPVTRRNYAKLTVPELNSLAERIKIFHENGIVVPDEKEDIKPCSLKKKGNRKKPISFKQRGEQIPGTQLGKGNIGANCSKYGVSKCLCCNDLKSPDGIQDDCLNIVNLNGSTSCNTFGIIDCSCCPKNESLDVDIMDVDHLSISQLQPADNPAIDSEENEDDHSLKNSVKLPGLPKHKLIEKFLDSFTHDRVDYSKPEQKNIVEGLIHNPVSYYSEHLCDDIDAPEKTILERVDFLKEQERLARLSLLMNKPSTSTRNTTYNSFKALESTTATSTPKPTPKTISFKTELSPIVGDLSTESPERPIENIEPINNCESESLPTVASIEEIAKKNPVKNDPLSIINSMPVDLSQIDRSFVTIRTPLKPRNLAVSDESIERLFESRQNTHRALASALEAIEVLDDDIHDNSVEIIDNPIECLSDDKSSDLSVQFVDDYRNPITDSDIQIIDAPSTLRSCQKEAAFTVLESSKSNLETPQKNNATEGRKIADCSICLEPLSQVKEVSSTTCGHIFCTACIRNVIKANKKCPICRTRLTLRKIHPLFLF